ncbi:MAG TPA: hypothetical protein VFE41_25060 [Acetobacteraceae bacterium]|jgi:hypothetical protein|nr:hypothetical protein [Acetobacteraceae bacterium]
MVAILAARHGRKAGNQSALEMPCRPAGASTIAPASPGFDHST